MSFKSHGPRRVQGLKNPVMSERRNAQYIWNTCQNTQPSSLSLKQFIMARFTRHARTAFFLCASFLFLSSIRSFFNGRTPVTPAPQDPKPDIKQNVATTVDCKETRRVEYRVLEGKGYPFPLFLATGRQDGDQDKMNVVREMMIHAWDNYFHLSPNYDELRPSSKHGHNWYHPYNLLSTPVDALDTLYIMGLDSRYEQAKKMVIEGLRVDIPAVVNVFETTIRVLGGLLAAWELDGDQRLLDRAVQLGDRLVMAFETPTGLPAGHFNLSSGQPGGHMGAYVNLAEIGTLQLEFQYLSDVTGNPIYAQKALHVYDVLHDAGRPMKGLYPIDWSTSSIRDRKEPAGEAYGIGAASDSFYEYLLKLWISTGDEKYREWYDEAAEAISSHLATTSQEGRYTYIPNARLYDSGFQKESTFHHLTCFAGGMFSTGALTRRRGPWIDLLRLGERVTRTCYESYNRTATGLGPESMHGADLGGSDSRYLLRPETVESIFYLWRYTHDPIYRQMGWQIIQSLNTYTRTPTGFIGLSTVSSNSPQPDDLQQSFFLAETLKYLFLLFCEDDVVPLEGFVFNTEAHALSVRGWGRRKGFVRGSGEVATREVDKEKGIDEKVKGGFEMRDAEAGKDDTKVEDEIKEKVGDRVVRDRGV
ncbi:uncharacterized protein SPPG_07516 [Spizellomyces punctatus DAOM BR117]|uniref:alpha-1,2-Mannosidase n=1 Tax=Spizellomyces punctatus (strain DAOM BR117) TaxID=645134 RepID=A0A0L0H867_SPIPD|nr:uncharacterized protein SPPG_07516 [Spizellomyces punctatus DAOM BR117]KNC97124.1 hypothetical protein SPPG_07516 [Spizellomyces punctatus DAOM BR117]|eukprot:XP_016605164.1 hypothetical protein SPPG_07516 [Spizellomyces punctatus DAOM BR117]